MKQHQLKIKSLTANGQTAGLAGKARHFLVQILVAGGGQLTEKDTSNQIIISTDSYQPADGTRSQKHLGWNLIAK